MKQNSTLIILSLSQVVLANSIGVPKGTSTQCDFHQAPSQLVATHHVAPPALAISDSSSVLALQSLPDAKGVIYINTTGKDFPADSYWAYNDKPFSLPGIGLGDDAIYATWLTLKEDFAPFNLNITTDSNVFNEYPIENRLEVIVSASSEKYSNRTGFAAKEVSYGTVTQAFCFSDAYKNDSDGYRFSEVCSHEAGHTFGLKHDGGPDGDYYFGHGDSDDYWKYWSTIMGSGTAAQISHWSKGDYSRATNLEDDISIISSFHFGTRPDDHSDSIQSATELDVIEEKVNQVDLGVIETRTDLDFFHFKTTGGVAHIEAVPAEYKPNLKIELTLWNELGEVVQTHKHLNSNLDAFIIDSLASGDYYVSIEGVGLEDVSGGFSDYGSLGYYSLKIDLNASEDLLTAVQNQSLQSKEAYEVVLNQGQDFLIETNRVKSVEVYSIQGEQVNIPYHQSKSGVRIHFHSVKNGVWFTKINGEDGSKIYKVVISN